MGVKGVADSLLCHPEPPRRISHAHAVPLKSPKPPATPRGRSFAAAQDDRRACAVMRGDLLLAVKAWGSNDLRTSGHGNTRPRDVAAPGGPIRGREGIVDSLQGERARDERLERVRGM